MVRLIAPLEGFVKDRRLADVLGSNLLEVEHSIGQRASGVGYRLGSRANRHAGPETTEQTGPGRSLVPHDHP